MDRMGRNVPAWVKNKIERWKCVKQDDNRNFLEECRRKSQLTYYLVLKWKVGSSRRNIWCVKKYKWNGDEPVLVVKRDENYHFHYKSLAYWFCDMFLRYLLWKFGNIKVLVKEKHSKDTYETNVEDILSTWQYLHFLKEWFEKQVMMKRSEMVLKK